MSTTPASHEETKRTDTALPAYRTRICSRGYVVVKSRACPDELRRCRKELMIKPFVLPEYAASVKPYPAFGESPLKLYMPKHYGLRNFGEPETVDPYRNRSIALDFNGALRPTQREACSAFLETCKRGAYVQRSRGGVISLQCGGGKTVCALYIVAQLKKKTLIVVHKEFLMHQWNERIRTFLPDARVGVIQQKKTNVHNKDIVIAMLQSIAMRDYPKEMFAEFGLAVFDECHHLSAEVFSRCLPKLGCQYTLGLSATPQRTDGLSKIFYWWLGPCVFSMTKNQTANVRAYQLNLYHPGYAKEEITRFGKICLARMINNVCAWAPRTRWIVALVRHLTRSHPKRQVLVLSSRRAHLQDLYDQLDSPETVGFYVGGMKQAALKESESKRVVLGTYAMSSEGLDIKSLNTLVMASPMSNVVQSVGRILRAAHPDCPPEIYDVCDCFSTFKKQAAKRARFYRKETFATFACEIPENMDLETATTVKSTSVPTSSKRGGRRKKKDVPEECLLVV